MRWKGLIMRSHLIAVLLLFLAGCSTVRLAYKQAHELAWWWVSDLVAFDDSQRPAVRQGLHQLQAWHRRSQLPATVDLLDRWQQAAAAELSRPQACAAVDEAVQRLAELPAGVDALPPATLEALATLTPAQLAGLERQLAKSNREFREKYVDPPAGQRARERFERTLSRAESFYGRLAPEQRRALAAALERSPWDAQASLSRRTERQQDWLQALRRVKGASADAVRAELRGLLARSLVFDDAARSQACQLLADLHDSATPVQRARAAETLGRYAGDLRRAMVP